MKLFEPLAPPVRWSRRPLVSFRQARARLQRELGAPQERDVDSNGIGAMDVWAMRFPCGLEMLLLAFHYDAERGREVSEDEPEPRWAVMRQDDNGHVFRVRELASRCAAEAALAQLEGLSHKQMYWLTSVDPA